MELSNQPLNGVTAESYKFLEGVNNMRVHFIVDRTLTKGQAVVVSKERPTNENPAGQRLLVLSDRNEIVMAAGLGALTWTEGVELLCTQAVVRGADYNMAYMNAVSMMSPVKSHPQFQPNQDRVELG